ncbi:hypothetical protein EI546_09650 [Aequorivita sp. H23M31]|uniref:Lipoprotein n=1 Tax=Aequorivita ciconiae TaxID=2494375 RepID=A0A410G3W9_9FLAO|nr:hypothetical protein [Aequorivita sp. H23M31]QAA81970.1 hypothetical protein EI546_09650 [Aequorivita sp. H23M31]
MRITIALITLFLFSCTNKEEQFFKNSLDSYIEKYPISLFYEVDSLGNRTLINCVYPYYEAVFFKDSTDMDILKIRQNLYYTQYKNVNNKELKGFFVYKNKYPVFVYDSYNLSGKYIFNKLNINVPDSLIYNKKCDGKILHNKNIRAETYKAE